MRYYPDRRVAISKEAVILFLAFYRSPVYHTSCRLQTGNGAPDTTLEAPGLVAVAPSHQVTDLVQTHYCCSLPLMVARDIAQPFQCKGHSGSASSSSPLNSAIASASNSSTRRRRRWREWRGDEHGPLVASDMESTELFSISVEQVEEQAPRLGIRQGIPPIQRALVLKTRARKVGANEGSLSE